MSIACLDRGLDLDYGVELCIGVCAYVCVAPSFFFLGGGFAVFL